MKIRRGPVALVLIALAADIAYIFLKGRKEITLTDEEKSERVEQKE